MAMADTMGVMPTYSLDGGNKDGFGGEGGFIWILFLFLILGFGGNGLGGLGGGAGANMINNDFMYTNLNASLNRMEGENSNNFRAIDNGLCNLGYTSLQNTNAIQSQLAACCCETQKEILVSRYEADKNTCAITNAIHADGEATRALINANTMQDLRDRLQAAEFGLSQAAQTANIVAQVRPMPIPAYVTCSPYTTPVNGVCGC